VEQKKNKDLKGQLKLNLPFKCTDNYLDGIEDIFGPGDNEEEPAVPGTENKKEWNITKKGKEYLKKHT